MAGEHKSGFGTVATIVIALLLLIIGLNGHGSGILSQLLKWLTGGRIVINTGTPNKPNNKNDKTGGGPGGGTPIPTAVPIPTDNKQKTKQNAKSGANPSPSPSPGKGLFGLNGLLNGVSTIAGGYDVLNGMIDAPGVAGAIGGVDAAGAAITKIIPALVAP